MNKDEQQILEEGLRKIIEECGADILLKEDRAVACFSDMLPHMAKEKNLFRCFLSCKGGITLLNEIQTSSVLSPIIEEQIATAMEYYYYIRNTASHSFVQTVWKALGGTVNKKERKLPEEITSNDQPPVLFVSVVTLVLLLFGFLFFHIWTPATCTTPEICSLCGKTRSPALGHDWLEATYDQSKTCTRCGLESGFVKGYLEPIPGSLSGKTVHVRGYQDSPVYELSRTVDNCFRVTMDITVTEYSGYPFGEWYLYVRSKSGHWSHICLFEITQDMVNTSTTIMLPFDSPTTITALALAQRSSNQYTVNYDVEFYAFQQYVD